MADDKALFLASVKAALVYIALLGMGMYVAGTGMRVGYLDPRIVFMLLGFEVVLSLFAIAFAQHFFGHWHCGLSPLRWRELVWLMPYVAMLVIFAVPLLLSPQASFSTTAMATLAAMIALGFSEELMFRGIVLQAARRQFGPARAVLVSAVMFTLMHVANLLAALTPFQLLPQLSFVFLFGIATSCIALRINSLVPLIAFHALWDMGQFLGRLWNTDFGLLPYAALAINTTMAAVMWLALAHSQKARKPA